MSEADIIRVFPRRTSYSPADGLAFVGEPPLLRPDPSLIREVRVSVTFTWDLPLATRLLLAWGQYYGEVRMGGPACNDIGHEFTPGLYVREGVTFTSRGCRNNCPWCLVPEREGRLRELPIMPGYIIQDNNFLQCSVEHRRAVYAMLAKQPKAAVFAGGLQPSLVTSEVGAELRDVRISQVFLAADSIGSLAHLERALQHLQFLPRRKLRCYVMIGFADEWLRTARWRLERVWELGAMPFAQLYQPASGRITYNAEWRALAKEWSRPAAMVASHEAPVRKEQENGQAD